MAERVHEAMRFVQKSLERIVLVCSALFSACNYEALGSGTGGVADEPAPLPGCPRGVTVLLSDRLSTQIALSALDGATRSESFLSSSSAKTDGLAFAFSGDVVLPSEPPRSGRIVLIDRYGTNVVTWADPSTARVLGQLSVGTGFESNPYDYIDVSDTTAYVARYGYNPEPGRTDFDAGGDVLVLDTLNYRITGRIPLARVDAEIPARPTRFTRLAGRIAVTVEYSSPDYTIVEDSELVGLDTELHAVAWRVPLPGMKGCGGAALTLDGATLVVACGGVLNRKGVVRDLSESGLVFLDASMIPPREGERVSAEQLFGEPIQSELAFATDDLVLLKTQTPLDAPSHNRLLAWDRRTRGSQELLRARPNAEGAGQGIVYGAIRCAPGCSPQCLMADGDRGVLQRVRVTEDGVSLDSPVVVERRVGLPPRDLSYR